MHFLLSGTFELLYATHNNEKLISYNCRTVALGVVNFLIAYVSLVIGFVVAFMVIISRKTQKLKSSFRSSSPILNMTCSKFSRQL